ncbi:uncharacterized protein BDR25DRAFT_360502 [Lindgomyces ingoldianus]|uniref:Uncharacterized protein n=1 Tax=Lindgomyces ingoldianus TaxID=673940 RepID=A0ACB6QHD9_9PLEO|nr:uncharacterized protein BDR25DRAFT_360502 [Lindgomyces ingoldianus]KAF2465561.1 hypothetical protein BDR25DRAFT_360502 [Lindgomyces ingoldianus]
MILQLRGASELEVSALEKLDRARARALMRRHQGVPRGRFRALIIDEVWEQGGETQDFKQTNGTLFAGSPTPSSINVTLSTVALPHGNPPPLSREVTGTHGPPLLPAQKVTCSVISTNSRILVVLRHQGQLSRLFLCLFPKEALIVSILNFTIFISANISPVTSPLRDVRIFRNLPFCHSTLTLIKMQILILALIKVVDGLVVMGQRMHASLNLNLNLALLSNELKKYALMPAPPCLTIRAGRTTRLANHSEVTTTNGRLLYIPSFKCKPVSLLRKYSIGAMPISAAIGVEYIIIENLPGIRFHYK